jgi:hypothetical protein
MTILALTFTVSLALLAAIAYDDLHVDAFHA